MCGNFGDYKSLSGGLYELRLTLGSGYKVYFGREDDDIVLLLCGGDKSSQARDIELARHYLNDYDYIRKLK